MEYDNFMSSTLKFFERIVPLYVCWSLKQEMRSLKFENGVLSMFRRQQF